MQPNQIYGPEQVPAPSPQNPYDFILNSGAEQKPGKFNLSGGNSNKQKVLIIVGGLLALFVVIIVFASLLGGGSSSNTEQLTTVANKQAEIIRLSNLATTNKSARNIETLELASNAGISVSSSQKEVLGILQKSGTKIKEKDLLLSKNPKSDEQLKEAIQNNTYDEVYVALLKAELKKYQSELKKAYDTSSSTNNKKILSDAFKGVTTLLGTEAKKPSTN